MNMTRTNPLSKWSKWKKSLQPRREEYRDEEDSDEISEEGDLVKEILKRKSKQRTPQAD